MTSPTKRLTERAEELLHTGVTLAVRVRRGPKTRPKGEGRTDPNQPVAGPSTFPAGGLPVVPALRSIRRAITDQFSDEEILTGVLAFTDSGDRLVLGRAQLRSLHPTHIVRELSRYSHVSLDWPLLTEHLIPELEIDGDFYIVNSVDFGVFAKAIATGELEIPELKEQLTQYYDGARSLATYDPNTIRSMMHS